MRIQVQIKIVVTLFFFLFSHLEALFLKENPEYTCYFQDTRDTTDNSFLTINFEGIFTEAMCPNAKKKHSSGLRGQGFYSLFGGCK